MLLILAQARGGYLPTHKPSLKQSVKCYRLLSCLGVSVQLRGQVIIKLCLLSLPTLRYVELSAPAKSIIKTIKGNQNNEPQKNQIPAQFEITQKARYTIQQWVGHENLSLRDYRFQSSKKLMLHITIR